MTRLAGTGIVKVFMSIALLTAATLVAEPVPRDSAFRAAGTELPAFFAGPWQPTGELALYNLSGDIVAYTFMFARPQAKSDTAAQERDPAAFVAKARAKLAADGKTVSANAPELYGEDRFASIVISADDTEPPVLRCFLGLPPQVVKEADALALAAKSGGAGTWRVRHYLMLGFFDVAFSLETATGAGAPLVVDMRTRSATTHAEAKARADAKRAAAPDPERVKKCRESWARYRTAAKPAAAQPEATPATGKTPKRVAVDEPVNQPLLSGPRENRR